MTLDVHHAALRLEVRVSNWVICRKRDEQSKLPSQPTNRERIGKNEGVLMFGTPKYFFARALS